MVGLGRTKLDIIELELGGMTMLLLVLDDPYC